MISFQDESGYADLIPQLKQFKDLKDRLAGLELELEQIKNEKLKVEQECLTMMDNAGIQSMSVDGVTIFPKVNTFASYNKDREQEAFQFVDDNGYGDIIKLTMNSKSLSSVVKELEESGVEIPEDLISVTKKRSLSVRKK